MIIDAFNYGATFLTFMGHGSTTMWDYDGFLGIVSDYYKMVPFFFFGSAKIENLTAYQSDGRFGS